VTAPFFRQGQFEGRLLWNSFVFAWPFVPAGIGHAINEMFDRFFLANMPADRASALYGMGVTPEEVAGIYNGSYKLAVFMLLFIQMFRMAWQPFFMRHSDNPRAPVLFARSFTGLNLIAALIFLAVGLFVKEIASLEIPYFGVSLLSPEYHSGLFIVPILLAAYWLYGWYIHFSAAIFIVGNTRVFSGVMIAGATVTITANYYLVPLFGMLGAALATLLSYLTMALLLLAVAQSRYPVPYRVWTGLFMIGFLLAGVWFENQMATLLYDWKLISTPDPMKWKLWFGGVLFVMLLVAAWRWRAKAKEEEMEELVTEEYSDDEVESEEVDGDVELEEGETIQENDEDESDDTESNDRESKP
jgi:O-antigen/teichoic acid export membrane protein